MKKAVTVKPTKSEVTSLAIKQSIAPPPTKTEVVQALLAMKKAEWEARNQQRKAEIQNLQEKIKAKAKRIYKKQVVENADISIESWRNSPRVEINLKLTSDLFDGDLEKFQVVLNSRESWDERTKKKEIQDAINGKKTGRVEAMLNTPEIREKLQTLATELGI